MKKLFKLVRMELQNSPQGLMTQLHLIDWYPATEQVNLMKEKLQKTLEAVKDIPEEIKAIIRGLAELAEPPAPIMSSMYYTSSVVSVTPKEYEEIGKPMLGSILSLELAKTEEVE